MQEKVIALFDNRAVVDEVMQDLLRNGFSQADIETFGSPAGGIPGTDNDSEKPENASYLGAGFMAGLRNFLSGVGLLEAGSGQGYEPNPEDYADRVRQGGVLVTVKANPYMAERARDILCNYNPLNVQEKRLTGQGRDMPDILDENDERRYERPAREAEMESIGERASRVPGYVRGTTQDAAWNGTERRSGGERRATSERRHDAAQSMNTDLFGA